VHDGLEQVRRDWERLGAEDPLWAVLMMPGTRHGGWTVDDFLRTGRIEVGASLAHLRSLTCPPRMCRAMDFGSGAGRTTQALADHVDTVVGVDAAESMIELARRLDETDGRCQFVHNTRDDLSMFETGSFDLVYSSLVLQHLPPTSARIFLGELARVVRPGGVLIVQVASTPTRSMKGWLFRYAPQPVLRFGQRRLLGYPAPMRMHGIRSAEVGAILAAHDVDVLDRVEDPSYGGHWSYHRYFAVRR
jgi:2-polyprenyl-3-methyl-5-hydroxy-6-metoxy-1,4-benzoquinol methylase